MADLGLEVRYDTVSQIVKSGSALCLLSGEFGKKIAHIIDIHGSELNLLASHNQIEFLEISKNQCTAFLEYISKIKREVADLELHLRGYFNLCNLAIKEIKEIRENE